MDGLVDGDSVVGRFEKSSTASVQVGLVRWQDSEYLDIREVVPSGDGFKFTRKGLRFKIELLPELIELLKAVPL